MSTKVLTSCTNAGPITVYVEDGRIVRIRPLVADEADFRPWTIEADGRRYSPPKKFNVAPFVLAERNRVYSEDRIRTPLKRVDFDPNGARNPQSRGKAGYERISWDEALDIVAGEIKRVQTTYGPAAVSAMTSSHHNWGLVGYKISAFQRFFNLIGYTPVLDNPGQLGGLALGRDPHLGLLLAARHARALRPARRRAQARRDDRLLVERSRHHARRLHRLRLGDLAPVAEGEGREDDLHRPLPQLHRGGDGRQMDRAAPRHRRGAGAGDRPCLDHAKAPTTSATSPTARSGSTTSATTCWARSDGVAKTPHWAAAECDVPARTIIGAGARMGERSAPMLAAGARGGEGGACRQAYGTEWARLMVLLQAMQGLGKPGISIWGTAMGAPRNNDVWFPGLRRSRRPHRAFQGRAHAAAKSGASSASTGRSCPTPSSIRRSPGRAKASATARSSSSSRRSPIRCRAARRSSCWYRYGGSFLGTMTDTSKWVRMYQSPKLEFVVNQDCWWSAETGFADIILPACTQLERDDIGEWGEPGGQTKAGSSGCNFRVIVRMKKCIEPLWESKSDYQIFTQLARRLGFEQEYTEGNSELDWARKFFEISDLPKYISWEEFDRKGYYIVNVPEDYKSTPALRWYAEGRACDTPDPSNPKRLTDKGARARHLQRQDRVHLAEPEGARARRRRAAARAALPAELGRPSLARGGENIRCSSSRRIRASRSTPITTSTPAGSTTSRAIACRRTATPGGRRASIPTTRPRAASKTATSSSSTTTGARCCASPSSPSGCGAASCTPTRRRRNTIRSSRAIRVRPIAAAASPS